MNPEDLAFLELFETRSSQSRIVEASFPQLAEWATFMGWDVVVTVPLKPEPGMSAGDCFSNVAHKIARDGGTAEYGRIFVLTPGQAIQTTSHAIWISPSGERVDITHLESGHHQSHVLFAPDPSVRERKGASPSYHCLLSADPKVRRIFALEQAIEDWIADAFISLNAQPALDYSILERIIEESELPEHVKMSIVENVLPRAL